MKKHDKQADPKLLTRAGQDRTRNSDASADDLAAHRKAIDEARRAHRIIEGL